MSDDQGVSGAGDAARGLQRDISNAVGQLGVGEKFAVLGCVAVLGVWLLMDLLVDRYSIGHLPFALALVVVYSAYRFHMEKAATWAIPYSTVVFAGAAIVGILGLWTIIEELRNDIFDGRGATVIGALAFWAASIVAGVGALQMKMSGR